MFNIITPEVMTQNQHAEDNCVSTANSANTELPEEIICGRVHRISASPKSHVTLLWDMLLSKKTSQISIMSGSKPNE